MQPSAVGNNCDTSACAVGFEVRDDSSHDNLPEPHLATESILDMWGPKPARVWDPKGGGLPTKCLENLSIVLRLTRFGGRRQVVGQQ